MYLNLVSPEDLAALYQEYQAKAVKLTETLTDKPWGMHEMLIEDVDGHILFVMTHKGVSLRGGDRLRKHLFRLLLFKKCEVSTPGLWRDFQRLG